MISCGLKACVGTGCRTDVRRPLDWFADEWEECLRTHRFTGTDRTRTVHLAWVRRWNLFGRSNSKFRSLSFQSSDRTIRQGPGSRSEDCSEAPRPLCAGACAVDRTDSERIRHIEARLGGDAIQVVPSLDDSVVLARAALRRAFAGRVVITDDGIEVHPATGDPA